MTLLWQEGWISWPTEVTSNPYHSVILWFCDTLWLSFEILIQFQKAGSDLLKPKRNTTPPHFGRVLLKIDPFPRLVQSLVPQTVILVKRRQWLLGTGKQEGSCCLAASRIHGCRAQQAFLRAVTAAHLQLPAKAARLAITGTDRSHLGWQFAPAFYRLCKLYDCEDQVFLSLQISGLLSVSAGIPVSECIYSRKKACFCRVDSWRREHCL